MAKVIHNPTEHDHPEGSNGRKAVGPVGNILKLMESFIYLAIGATLLSYAFGTSFTCY